MDKKTTFSLLGLVLVVLVLGLGFTLHGNSSGDKMCRGASHAYTVTINDSRVSNADVKGKLCDTVTFVNKDNISREIAFGPHEDHVPYDGVAEKVLNQNQKFTITLNKTGNYHWHDHVHDEVEGYFTVSK